MTTTRRKSPGFPLELVGVGLTVCAGIVLALKLSVIHLPPGQLAAENLAAFRWWQLSQIASYTGRDLFSPRDLATPLTALLTTGTPTHPVQLGLQQPSAATTQAKKSARTANHVAADQHE